METLPDETGFDAVLRHTARLQYISKSRFGGDWHSTPHSHGCTELFYCLSGMGKFQIGNKLYDVLPDDIVIVNPHVQHTEISASANPLEYIVIGIADIGFTFSENSPDHTIMNCRETRNHMTYLLHMLLQEIGDKCNGYETVCQDLLEVLLIQLVRGSRLGLRKIIKEKPGSDMAAVRHYIDEHFSENITLDLLAEYAHLNKYYLSHAFVQEYGTSPINYLIAHRITQSRYLLTNTNHSLSKICALVGFSSPSYFAQVFKKSEGISPSGYRKAEWNFTGR